MIENHVTAHDCEREVKYSEILELKRYCDKIGVEAKLLYLFDGYTIRFNNGADFIQHDGSYGHDAGYVEPAGFNDNDDYTAVSLSKAKTLVRNNKDRLNKVVRI